MVEKKDILAIKAGESRVYNLSYENEVQTLRAICSAAKGDKKKPDSVEAYKVTSTGVRYQRVVTAIKKQTKTTA